MKRLVAFGVCLAFFLCGCATDNMQSSMCPESKKYILNELVKLKPNMTPEEVVGLMGRPERPITIYFYQTEKDGFFSRFSRDNYTPLVFVGNKLSGWGWNYLNHAAKNIMSN